MEQINLEATQSILRERHAQVVRDAETRRMLQERRAAGAISTRAAAPASRRAGILVRLAAMLRPAHRRPALT
jgi:hypothetical protein